MLCTAVTIYSARLSISLAINYKGLTTSTPKDHDCHSSVAILQHFFQLWFLWGIIFSATAILVALCKPYKKTYANVLDTLSLFYFAIFCQILSSNRQFEILYFVPLMQIIVLIPLGIFVMVIVIKLIHGLHQSYSQKSLLSYRAHVNVNHCTSQYQRIEPIATYGI